MAVPLISNDTLQCNDTEGICLTASSSIEHKQNGNVETINRHGKIRINKHKSEIGIYNFYIWTKRLLSNDKMILKLRLNVLIQKTVV